MLFVVYLFSVLARLLSRLRKSWKKNLHSLKKKKSMFIYVSRHITLSVFHDQTPVKILYNMKTNKDEWKMIDVSIRAAYLSSEPNFFDLWHRRQQLLNESAFLCKQSQLRLHEIIHYLSICWQTMFKIYHCQTFISFPLLLTKVCVISNTAKVHTLSRQWLRIIIFTQFELYKERWKVCLKVLMLKIM